MDNNDLITPDQPADVQNDDNDQRPPQNYQRRRRRPERGPISSLDSAFNSSNYDEMQIEMLQTTQPEIFKANLGTSAAPEDFI